MTKKFLASALLASTAALSLATTALADDTPAPGAATGYVYPDFWTTSSTAKQQPGTAAPERTTGPSIGLYFMRRSHDTYLFPPNPNW
jgi:hypothetical protein